MRKGIYKVAGYIVGYLAAFGLEIEGYTPYRSFEYDLAEACANIFDSTDLPKDISKLVLTFFVSKNVANTIVDFVCKLFGLSKKTQDVLLYETVVLFRTIPINKLVQDIKFRTLVVPAPKRVLTYRGGDVERKMQAEVENPLVYKIPLRKQ